MEDSNWNTGYRNTGDWNTGDWNTGFFNTITPKKILVFNSECDIEIWDNAEKPDLLYFNLTEWVSENNMTLEEKESNPTYKTTNGYLKSYDYKEAFKKSWDSASEEDRKLVEKLPNFNADIFLEISGIDVRKSEIKEMTLEDVNNLLGFKIKIVE